MVAARPVIIEAALNGGTKPDRVPGVPIAPADIARQGMDCIAVGAAIVHSHSDGSVLAERVDAARYVEAWEPILARYPRALLYPTATLA